MATTPTQVTADFSQLVAELRKPILPQRGEGDDVAFIPEGYRVEDLERWRLAPRRKTGTIATHTTESFIDVVKRFGSLATCNVYLDVDYAAQRIVAAAVFNDHADGDGSPGWRDHRCTYTPRFTEDWRRWNASNKKTMTQAELAHFLEDNLTAIVSSGDLPTGGDVLAFVSALSETRKVKYGSAVNLQNGMVQIEFIEEGDNGQRGKLDVFREFALALRPFSGSETYQVRAFLRYRIDRNTGGISFWYELRRPDLVLEDACKATVAAIIEKTGMPVVFGTP